MDVAQTFAATFVDELAAQGVEYACVSPGSRSAPIAMALQRHPRIKVIVQIDERSSSFFALGLGKATGKPAVALCTSGTAAAEFHPAVVEAFYSRSPLIVVTADRPPELRDVGANQAIDQQQLYGTAVRWFFDPGTPVDIPGAPRIWRRLAARAVAEAAGGPVHLVWRRRSRGLDCRFWLSPARSSGVPKPVARSSRTKPCCVPAGRSSTGRTS